LALTAPAPSEEQTIAEPSVGQDAKITAEDQQGIIFPFRFLWFLGK
jgi:hypothetical protein